jgi:hypothetical protein
MYGIKVLVWWAGEDPNVRYESIDLVSGDDPNVRHGSIGLVGGRGPKCTI